MKTITTRNESVYRALQKLIDDGSVSVNSNWSTKMSLKKIIKNNPSIKTIMKNNKIIIEKSPSSQFQVFKV